MRKTRIDIEPLLEADKVFTRFNRLDLTKHDFYLKGKKIPITKKQLSDFKYTGLANYDFFLTDYLVRKKLKQGE